MKEKSYEEIFSLFEEIAHDYKRSDQYVDILYDSISSIRITKSPSEETIAVSSDKSGIVARTFVDSWKEMSVQKFEDLDKIKQYFPRATNKGSQLKEFDGWELNEEIETQIDPREIPIDEKIQKVRNAYQYLKDYDERIVNPIIAYLELYTTRIFVNNEGSRLRQVIPRIRIVARPVAKEGRNIDFDYVSLGGEIGFEVFNNIDEHLERVAQNSLEMLKAESAPSGNYPIILDPDMAGLIAHESFGHGLEADQIIRDRSYLKDKLNKPVASEMCDIYDAANIKDRIGSYLFDDEGIKPSKNVLVEDGILKNFIYDRRTASELDAIPKGNGRRQSYAHPIHVRMSNTYFGTGDQDLDEMIAGIDKGVMLIRGFFGMEDPLGGGLQVTSKKGYLIENGQKTKLLKAVTLSGSVLELLKNIDAVSKDKLDLSAGTCGKGYEDFVPVTSGGSYLRVKKALISPGG
jgi:TldD protein